MTACIIAGFAHFIFSFIAGKCCIWNFHMAKAKNSLWQMTKTETENWERSAERPAHTCVSLAVNQRRLRSP